MLFKMNLQDKPFNMIKKGIKDLELRLYDEKRKKIQIGDYIEFENNNGDSILVCVINVHRFSNFEELYKSFEKTRLGYEENEKKDYHDMQKYYDINDINKYGVVAIEIKLVDKNLDIGFKNNYGSFKLRVAGIIIENNKILLCKAKKFNGFVFPGGHVMLGELSSDSVKRELKEELQMNFLVEDLFCIQEFCYKTKDNSVANEICFYYKIKLLDNVSFCDYTIEENDKGIIKTHEFVWIDINKIDEYNINPKDIVKCIKENKDSKNLIISSYEK